MQEHARVSENRSRRNFQNPVLAYVTPWYVIAAIRHMLLYLVPHSCNIETKFVLVWCAVVPNEELEYIAFFFCNSC